MVVVYICIIMVWVRVEATCKVAVVCYHDAASIHIMREGYAISFLLD